MGGGRRMSVPLMMSLVLIVGVSVMSLAEAQSSTPSCAQQLIPCASYLNSTNPPNSCCDPLKQTVATQLPCLCSLFNSPGLLESFGINITQALELSRRCGITSGVSSCKASAPPPSTTSLPPPVTPGGERGGAGRVAFTGLSFLLLFWASMLFN